VQGCLAVSILVSLFGAPCRATSSCVLVFFSCFSGSMLLFSLALLPLCSFITTCFFLKWGCNALPCMQVTHYLEGVEAQDIAHSATERLHRGLSAVQVGFTHDMQRREGAARQRANRQSSRTSSPLNHLEPHKRAFAVAVPAGEHECLGVARALNGAGVGQNPQQCGREQGFHACHSSIWERHAWASDALNSAVQGNKVEMGHVQHAWSGEELDGAVQGITGEEMRIMQLVCKVPISSSSTGNTTSGEQSLHKGDGIVADVAASRLGSKENGMACCRVRRPFRGGFHRRLK
jgi:hypothetical protein